MRSLHFTGQLRRIWCCCQIFPCSWVILSTPNLLMCLCQFYFLSWETSTQLWFAGILFCITRHFLFTLIHLESSHALIINLHVKIQASYLQTMNLGKRVYENMQVFIHYYRQSFVYYHNPTSNRADAREISFLSASVFIFCVRRSFLTTLMFT